MYERGLMDRLRANVGAKPPGALQDVEAIFAAGCFLRGQDERPRDERADAESVRAVVGAAARLRRRRRARGSGTRPNLDPWEHSRIELLRRIARDAGAVDRRSADYQQRADTRERVAALSEYLAASADRPLHDRLGVLWASSTRPSGLCPTRQRASLIGEVFARVAKQAGTVAGRWSRSVRGPFIPMRHRPPVAMPMRPAYGIRARSGGHSAIARGIVSCAGVAPRRIRTRRPAPGQRCP